MNKTTQSADTIDVSRLSLEGGSNLHPAVFTDESILDDASRYNIDLDALENSGAQAGDGQIFRQNSQYGGRTPADNLRAGYRR